MNCSRQTDMYPFHMSHSSPVHFASALLNCTAFSVDIEIKDGNEVGVNLFMYSNNIISHVVQPRQNPVQEAERMRMISHQQQHSLPNRNSVRSRRCPFPCPASTSPTTSTTTTKPSSSTSTTTTIPTSPSTTPSTRESTSLNGLGRVR